MAVAAAAVVGETAEDVGRHAGGGVVVEAEEGEGDEGEGVLAVVVVLWLEVRV